MEPFDLLLDIEQQCLTHAKPLPRQNLIGKIWQGIGFKLRDEYFVVPLNEVVEIMPLPPVTPLPGSVNWFIGVTNLRGSPLPVTDLQAFIAGIPLNLTPLSRVIVIDFEEDSRIGVLVSQVLGIQRFNTDNLSKVDETMNEKFQPYLQGEFLHGSNKWRILSFKMLTQSPQFYHVIKEMET